MNNHSFVFVLDPADAFAFFYRLLNKLFDEDSTLPEFSESEDIDDES